MHLNGASRFFLFLRTDSRSCRLAEPPPSPRLHLLPCWPLSHQLRSCLVPKPGCESVPEPSLLASHLLSPASGQLLPRPSCCVPSSLLPATPLAPGPARVGRECLVPPRQCWVTTEAGLTPPFLTQSSRGDHPGPAGKSHKRHRDAVWRGLVRGCVLRWGTLPAFHQPHLLGVLGTATEPVGYTCPRPGLALPCTSFCCLPPRITPSVNRS